MTNRTAHVAYASEKGQGLSQCLEGSYRAYCQSTSDLLLQNDNEMIQAQHRHGVNIKHSRDTDVKRLNNKIDDTVN